MLVVTHESTAKYYQAAAASSSDGHVEPITPFILGKIAIKMNANDLSSSVRFHTQHDPDPKLIGPKSQQNTLDTMKSSILKSPFHFLQRITVLAVFLTICSAASAQVILWSAEDATNGVSSNWSDPTNWLGGVLPGAANAAVFGNAGQSSGTTTPDNIADSNFTIDALWYAATNLSPNFAYHNTQISSGVTLTVSDTNAAIVLDSGTQNDPYGSGPDWGLAASYSTIAGDGTLLVDDTNGESVMIVSQGSSQYTGKSGLWATLDMSKLSTFDGTFGRLLVGLQGVGPTTNEVSLNSSGRQSGLLSLAATNIIHLTQVGNNQGTGAAAAGGAALVINDCPFFGDNGSYIYLGQSNALWADTITVGRQQCSRSAVMEFNPGITGPAQFWLRGESSNRVSEFVVADNTVNGGNCNASPNNDANGVVLTAFGSIVVPPGGFQVGSAGVFDVSAGSSDMMIDTLIIGKGYQGAGAGYAAGIFSMGSGTLDINTLQLGVMSSTNETAPVTGVFNDIGGTVTVNSGPITLGVELASPATTYATGTLTMLGGSLNVANGAYGIVDDGLSESTVLLTNASVTAANIGSASAPIGTVVMGDSTLNLALNGLEGAVVAESVVTTSTNVGNTINITSISGFVGGQAVVTLVQSDNPISYTGSFAGGAGGTDFVLGSLPAGYQGSLQVNASSVQLVLSQTPVVPNTWTGTGIASLNTNWSDAVNWSSGAEPAAGSAGFFATTASVSSSALSVLGGGPGDILPAKINNIVDGNVTILGLDYANINGTYQNTFIDSGVTLNVGEGGLTVGSPVVDEGNTSGNATISGAGGALSIDDPSAIIYVGLGHSNSVSTAEATLDMSGLGTFDADVGSFLVGVGAVGFTSVLQPVGTVYLAQSNSIIVNGGNGGTDSTLVALDIGDAGDAETAAGFGDSSSSTLYLGWTNAIWADFIDIGRQWASGAIYFNPAVTNANPSVSIRGTSGNSVTVWNIGDGAENLLSGGGSTGVADFSGGSINAMVNTLGVAVSSPNSTSASSVVQGTLTIAAGTIWANTVNISDNPAGAVSPAEGTVNVNGAGTLSVSGTLNLGLTPGSPSATPSATLNINGGAVWANAVAAGTNGTVSTINMSGGWLAATNGLGVASAPVTTLNLTNSTIIGAAGATALVNAENISTGGASNTIVLLSLPPAEVYPITVTLIQSDNPITGSLNFQAQAPAGYTGLSVSEIENNTAVILTVQNGPVTARGIVHWVGPTSGNMNWSDGTNWFLPPTPATPDIAFFDNAGESLLAGAGNVDNIADISLTIAGLWYAATNASADFQPTPVAYHNTVINSGVTVMVANTNPVIVLDCGTQSDPASGNTSSYATISGAGALVANDPNPESIMIVSQGSSTYSYPSAQLWASLDMSGLNSFNGTFGRLLLGVQGVGVTPGEVALNGSGRQTGTLDLALTNVIHLTQTGNNQGGFSAAAGGPALVIFDSGYSGDNPSQLHLGLSNAIYADTITVGRTGVQSGVLDFNPNLAGTPQLLLRGESSSRVSEMIVADSTWEGGESQYELPDPRIVVTAAISANGTLNEAESGIMDASLGTVDMMIDTLIVGKGYNGGGSGYVVGQLNIGGGTANVNTLELGAMSATNTSTTVTGILNVTNATLIVNNVLALGAPMGAATAPYAAGNLNLSASTLEASAIIANGSANSYINMSGGILSLTSPGGSIGTAAAPVGNITLSGGTTLNLAVGSFPAVVAGTLTASGLIDTLNLTTLPLTHTVPSTNTLIQSINGAIGSYDFVLGSPLPSGFQGYIQQSTDGTAVQLVLTNAVFPTNGVTITSAALQAGSIVLSGTNGLANGAYFVLSSTNLAQPWTPIATNAFDGSGNFNVSFPTTSAQQFFKIESQ